MYWFRGSQRKESTTKSAKKEQYEIYKRPPTKPTTKKETKSTLAIRAVDKELARALKLAAKNDGRSFSSFAKQVLRLYLIAQAEKEKVTP